MLQDASLRTRHLPDQDDESVSCKQPATGSVQRRTPRITHTDTRTHWSRFGSAELGATFCCPVFSFI
ncbi:hypothetical protein BS78_05G249800 [Paspalum vaginatum]|nr:hypothetical protein BS78_05G249800 [Paspalum vaginatum]